MRSTTERPCSALRPTTNTDALACAKRSATASPMPAAEGWSAPATTVKKKQNKKSNGRTARAAHDDRRFPSEQHTARADPNSSERHGLLSVEVRDETESKRDDPDTDEPPPTTREIHAVNNKAARDRIGNQTLIKRGQPLHKVVPPPSSSTGNPRLMKRADSSESALEYSGASGSFAGTPGISAYW